MAKEDLKSFVAGGLAGCAAKTVIAPLDRVKILFQTSNPTYSKYSGSFFGVFNAMSQIYQHNGFSGIFQGHSATLVRIFPYAAIKFMTYERLKCALMPSRDLETSFRRALAGSLAELIRVRLAFQVRNSEQKISIASTCSSIFKEQNPFITSNTTVAGILNFYRGLFPTIYGMIPYAGVSFLTYETLKDQSLYNPHFTSYTLYSDENGVTRLKNWALLSCGALSGATAQTASYPFEIVRRRMQVAGMLVNSVNLTSTWKTIQYIHRSKGLPGFFVGLSIGYLKVTPMFAVSFFTYEWLKSRL